MLVNGRRVLLAAQTHVFPSSDTEGESGSGTMEQINGKQLTIRRPVDGTQHLLKCMSENGVSPESMISFIGKMMTGQWMEGGTRFSDKPKYTFCFCPSVIRNNYSLVFCQSHLSSTNYVCGCFFQKHLTFELFNF
jgi:hypothetical protein